MNADIISMYVKLPLFKHFEQFLWHSCISIICQKIPGRSLSVMFNYYSSERIHACSHRLNSCQKQLIKQTWYFSGIICGIAVCSTPVILQHKVTQHIFWMFCFYYVISSSIYRAVNSPELSRRLHILDRISWSPDYEISQLLCVV